MVRLRLGTLSLESQPCEGPSSPLQALGTRPQCVSSLLEAVRLRAWEGGFKVPLQVPREGLGWQVPRNLQELESMNRFLVWSLDRRCLEEGPGRTWSMAGSLQLSIGSDPPHGGPGIEGFRPEHSGVWEEVVLASGLLSPPPVIQGPQHPGRGRAAACSGAEAWGPRTGERPLLTH